MDRVVLVVIIWDGWGGGGVGDAKEREIDLQISDLQRLTSLYQIDSPLTVHWHWQEKATKQNRWRWTVKTLFYWMISFLILVTSIFDGIYLFHPTGTEELPTTYTNGPKDFCTIFFYSLAWIVVHAIIQEYVWDVSRKTNHFQPFYA